MTFHTRAIFCSTLEELAKEARVSLAKWSPIGSELTYVQDNDIYHAVFKAGKNALRRVTKSGKPGIVFNGIPDWVYEGEDGVNGANEPGARRVSHARPG